MRPGSRIVAIVALSAVGVAGELTMERASAGSESLDSAQASAAAIATPPVQENAQMVLVPAGEFEMGSREPSPDCGDSCRDEVPVHKVYVDSFWIDKTEVTVAEYRRCVAANKCSEPSACCGANWGQLGRDGYPVNCVDWFQAKAYCEWAGKRLPTEAEWEKAARGDDEREYPWGDAAPSREYVVSSSDDGGSPGLLTSPVGSRPLGASPCGALDMAGNVYEWLADWYGRDYYVTGPTCNPGGPASGTERAVRGGPWCDGYWQTFRIANRGASFPFNRVATSGFRCARGDAAGVGRTERCGGDSAE